MKIVMHVNHIVCCFTLQYLGLSNTSISGVPEGMLHDLNNLNSLDLSYNLFKRVPTELSHTHQLKVLTLDGNLFDTLDKESFQVLLNKIVLPYFLTTGKIYIY
jgi:Leucine-rich repeat (LRR) protein